MAVGVPDSDSTYSTTVTLGGGMGRHGTGLDVYLGTMSGSGYECDGTYVPGHEVRGPLDLEETFTDIGGGIDHRVGNSRVHLGVRGGYVWEEATLVGSAPINPFTNEPVDLSEAMGSYAKTAYWYVNPYLAIEASNVGIGFGVVRSQIPLRTDKEQRIPEDLGKGAGTQPSFHLRLGPRDLLYVSYSLWEGIPIYSGGGMHNAGVGFQPGRQLDVWAGYAFGGPYQTDGVYLRTTVGAASPVALNLSLRVPATYQTADGIGWINEVGGSVGVQFRR
jgi:hypothetical protein